MGLSTERETEVRAGFDKVSRVLETCEAPSPRREVPTEEFVRRQHAVMRALEQGEFDVGIVFGDPYYSADVAYLGGNIHISVEQVVGVLGRTGFHLAAGPEGCFAAEHWAGRSQTRAHLVDLLHVGARYHPLRPRMLRDVVEAANDGAVNRIALLSPRQMMPADFVDYLNGMVGRDNVQEQHMLLQELRYEKSDIEMELIRDAAHVADAMLRAMLAVLQPGVRETQVAAWGEFVARELGAESSGFQTMVSSGEGTRALISPALNRTIRENDWVTLGVAPQRDGLTGCARRTVVAGTPSPDQAFWLEFLEGAYVAGYRALTDVARRELPAKYHEMAVVKYFHDHTPDVVERFGAVVAMEHHKTGNSLNTIGYDTGRQAFRGPATRTTEAPLGRQVALTLEVGVRGMLSSWNDVLLPGLDHIVVANTIGKFGASVSTFNQVPVNAQLLVGATP